MTDLTATPTPTRWWNNFWLLLAALLAFALAFNREGVHVPTGNEWIYLLYFYKAWHPAFLATDWTMQEPTAGHAVFNVALGWMSRLTTLGHAAWIGRGACWAATFVALLRIGRRYQIPASAVWLGLMFWLLQGQSAVTREWVIGSFEAKCIAYVFLLFGIDAALAGRTLLAGVLAGAAFSFHTAVGMWGGAALGVAVLLNYPWRQTAWFAGATVACALPGLITSLPLLFGPGKITPEQAKFFATVALPTCLDPFNFSMRWMVLLALLPVFAVVHASLFRGDRAIRMLLQLEASLAVFFWLGVLARWFGRFDLVLIYPLRVYAVLVLLLFYWQLASVVLPLLRGHGQALPRRRVWGLATVGLVLFLGLPSPVLQGAALLARPIDRLREAMSGHLRPNTSEDRDYGLACQWVADHTPVDAVVIAPPWRAETFYIAQRPLIANWHAPRYNALTEWKQRIEALVGDVDHLTPADELAGDMDAVTRAHYRRLSPGALAVIRHRFGGDFLITTGTYADAPLFASGLYRVYRLPLRATPSTQP